MSIRRRRRSHTPQPPNIGWDALYLADEFGLNDDTTITSSWSPLYGSTALTLAGTPKYRHRTSLWNGQPYIQNTAIADGFYGAIGNIAQPFVIVSGELTTGIHTSSTGIMFDAYTNGTLPANRAFWQYYDTTVDQTRIWAGAFISANWSTFTLNTERLVESIFDGASSTQKYDGTTWIATANAGANSMDGLATFRYAADNGVDTRRYSFIGRISLANWNTGRAEFVDWYNRRYAQVAA